MLHNKVKEENERLKNEIERLQEKLKGIVKNTKEVLKQQREKSAKVSRIAEYSIYDNDFLNKLAEIAELREIKFMFDTVHREIYEAALLAPNDEMILNAIGKGKGIRVLERKFGNPKSLFTEEIEEMETDEPEI